jgi:hypothetical protein
VKLSFTESQEIEFVSVAHSDQLMVMNLMVSLERTTSSM